MQLAMIGLGKMGGNMSARLLRAGHSVVVHDRDPATIAEYVKLGGTGARDLAEVVGQLSPRRIVWLMIPAGAPVDETIAALKPLLAAGDIIIDGGNSNYHDTKRRAAMLAPDGIELVDCGLSAAIVSSTGAPAGIISHTILRGLSWPTTSARSRAPVPPSFTYSAMVAGSRSCTTTECPVRIENVGERPAQLLSRRWLIHDSIGEDTEVVGDGVVGQQPLIAPGHVHEYRSFCVLKSPEGYMEGQYNFMLPDGGEFSAEIPRFLLSASSSSGLPS